MARNGFVLILGLDASTRADGLALALALPKSLEPPSTFRHDRNVLDGRLALQSRRDQQVRERFRHAAFVRGGAFLQLLD